VRTLHLSLRVADEDRSLAFYTALGYEVIGTVPDTSIGRLTMLKLPDDEFVSVELVFDPAGDPVEPGTGPYYFVVKVESMAATIAHLAAAGIEAEPLSSPGGPDDLITTFIADPDGNRIELVQWPAGHPAGITAADGPS
jgi:lactoylglutathione lyase